MTDKKRFSLLDIPYNERIAILKEEGARSRLDALVKKELPEHDPFDPKKRVKTLNEMRNKIINILIDFKELYTWEVEDKLKEIDQLIEIVIK